MEETFEVITFGAATIDILIQSESIRLDKNRLSIESSSKNEINRSLISSGGGATNTAVAFSRMGIKTACVAQVGNDYLANYVWDDLNKEGVGTSMVVKSGQRSDFSVIMVDKTGGRTVMTDRGLGRLELKDVNFDTIGRCKWFYITSLEGNVDLLEKLIGFAKEKGIKVAVNPGNREIGQPKTLRPLLAHVDFLLLNGPESEALSGHNRNEKDYWKIMRGFECPLVAITDGRNGAHLVTKDMSYFSPIINVRPIDETGAGDAFGSGLVGGMVCGETADKALKWGIKNSASVVAYLGAKTGLLRRTEISSNQ